MHTVKSRQKSKLLVSLQLLDKRMNLSEEDKLYLYKLEKGFEGEELFDSYVKKYLNKEGIILNDLLLTIRGTTIQIDALLITANGVTLYEIKNYKGNYQMQAGRFTTMNGQEMTNPTAQLTKSLIKMRQLFQDWGIEETVEGAVIFVEPSFFLYHSVPSDPFIFPTQIETHFTALNRKLTHLSKSHHYLADRLLHADQRETPYEKQLPAFEYPLMRKGLSCLSCLSYDLDISQRTCQCNDCQSKHAVESTVVKNIQDLKILFPDIKLTTPLIYDWCGRTIVFKRVRLILQKNYSAKGTSRGTYFV